MERENSTCPFCPIGSKKKSFYDNEHSRVLNQYVRQGVDISNSVLFQTDHFQVKPDILPGHPEGRHLLLFPREHVLSLRELPLSLGGEIGYILHEMEYRFGNIVFFEHGSGNETESTPQSVFHAHGHIYAAEGIDIVSYMKEILTRGLGNEREVYSYNLTGERSLSPSVLEGIHQFVEPGGNYLYIQQGRDGFFVNLPWEAKSQIAQRSMHLLYSGEVLNWKEIPQSEALQVLAVQRIINLIENCEF